MSLATTSVASLLSPQAKIQYQVERLRQKVGSPLPPGHLLDIDTMLPVSFHRGQEICHRSERRVTAMLAGSQGGKTCYGPIWLNNKINIHGGGDWLAVTASFDLFKLKMLPTMRAVFEDYLGIGRYWAQSRIIELANPQTGEFKAKRADDAMWGRIILRSADALGGLESATAKGAWLDEAGQDRFTVDAWRAVKRRLALARGDVLITTTLYNLGWIVQQIIDPAEKDGIKSVEQIGEGELEWTDNEDADICLVQFDSIVNPTYPIEEYRDAESSLPPDEFQMFYRGRKAALRYLIYDAFDRTRHTCPRFELPLGWPRYLGLDFGGANTAGMFYAEDPGTKRLYAYREYLAGKRTAGEHATELLRDEPGLPRCVGGSKSEGQWRLEFAQGGLPVLPPMIKDVNLGIQRVYGQHTQDGIIYFDDLQGILDEKGRYQRKRDKSGEVTAEIKDKNRFHRIDAERYIIGDIRPPEVRIPNTEKRQPLTQQSRWHITKQRTGSRWKR